MPAVSASASIDASETLHITLSNANPHKDIAVKVNVGGMKANGVHGRLLQADTMDACNTFEQPNTVVPREFKGVQLSGEEIEVTLPKMSVVVLALK